MKIRANPAAGLTKLEVLVVIVVLVLLVVVAVFLPNSYRDWKQRSNLALCQGNLKQIVLGFQMWINDSDGQAPPWFTPAKDGGTAEFVPSGKTFRHFQVASNEFGSPKILVCPADKERGPAANWREFYNTNLSYFAGMTVDERSSPWAAGGQIMWSWLVARDEFLTGDRHITGGRLTNHLLTLVSDSPAGWQPAIHGGSGNIGFFSGEMRSMTTNQLRAELQKRNYEVRLAMP